MGSSASKPHRKKSTQPTSSNSFSQKTPPQTSNTSFQPHYYSYSRDLSGTPDSPPAFSYKPPPQSTPTPPAASHYNSCINKPPVTSFTRSSSSSKTTPSSTIEPSSSSPKQSTQPTSPNSKPNPSSQKTPPAYSRDLLPPPDSPPVFSYLPSPPIYSFINKPPVTSFVSSSSSSKPTPSKPNPSSQKPPPQTWSPCSPKVSLVYKPILKPASSSSSSNVTSQHQQDREKTACVCVEEAFVSSSSSSKPTPSSTSKPSSSSTQPTSSNSKPNRFSQETLFGTPDSPPAFSYKPAPQSTPSPPVYSFINKPPVTSFISSSSTIKPSSPKVPPVSPVCKSILRPASSSSSSSNITSQHQQYVCVEVDSLPVFMIPEDIKALIKNGIVPKIFNRPLSPTTYKDYFAALLYSEDFYMEKWSDFLLKNVTLELEKSEIFKDGEKEEKTFVAFELDSVPEKRPFLLSRDLVFARPVGYSTAEPFQGNIYKVVKSKRVLVEFKGDFYSKHHSNKTYDVSFSFNRVCLKRAHHAVETASDALFQNFLFPDCDSRASIRTTPALPSTTCHNLRRDQRSAVEHILRIQGSPPYVVTGPKPLRTRKVVCASTTREVVSEAVYQLCKKSPEHRILICAPTNNSCDVLMRSLATVIPQSTMFRANAAFREKDEVPEDILLSSLHNESCFYCPPIKKLRKYRVIFSTFVSSFRLHDKGIAVGHFSHIFLVDASSAIEPETLVTLTNFADKTTSVIVTGNPGDDPRWVRADIARKKGLKISYFERLCKRSPYTSLSPMFITKLDGS